MPQLGVIERAFWRAFSRLSRSRFPAFAGVSPISFRDLSEYARAWWHGEAEDLFEVIEAMDNHYLDIMSRKARRK